MSKRQKRTPTEPEPKPIRFRLLPRNDSQTNYLDAIRNSDITFGIGPAGTGKTFVATAAAVLALKDREVSKIILARPAVEAGEKLGFLPGSLQDKVDPYMLALYDALGKMLPPEKVKDMIESKTIEVAAIGFLRGRTLENSFVIIDEAQNLSREQLKMVLTRFGPGSKMVVNGDITQIDLPDPKKSGLVEALRILKNVKEVSCVHFLDKDVVRHSTVKKIVEAYQNAE